MSKFFGTVPVQTVRPHKTTLLKAQIDSYEPSSSSALTTLQSSTVRHVRPGLWKVVMPSEDQPVRRSHVPWHRLALPILGSQALHGWEILIFRISSPNTSDAPYWECGTSYACDSAKEFVRSCNDEEYAHQASTSSFTPMSRKPNRIPAGAHIPHAECPL